MMSNDGGLFVGPSDGHVLTNPIGGRMVLKATDHATGGAYSLHESVWPARSPDPGRISTTSMTRPSTSWRVS